MEGGPGGGRLSPNKKVPLFGEDHLGLRTISKRRGGGVVRFKVQSHPYVKHVCEGSTAKELQLRKAPTIHHSKEEE